MGFSLLCVMADRRVARRTQVRRCFHIVLHKKKKKQKKQKTKKRKRERQLA